AAVAARSAGLRSLNAPAYSAIGVRAPPTMKTVDAMKELLNNLAVSRLRDVSSAELRMEGCCVNHTAQIDERESGGRATNVRSALGARRKACRAGEVDGVSQDAGCEARQLGVNELRGSLAVLNRSTR